MKAATNSWPTSKLGKHVKIYSGVAPSQISIHESGKYPFVKVEDLNNCSKYQKTSRFFTNDKNGYFSDLSKEGRGNNE